MITAGILNPDGSWPEMTNAQKSGPKPKVTVEPEDMTGGLRNLPGVHVPPESAVEMPEPQVEYVTKRVRVNNDTALAHAFRTNLEFEHKVCQFTGERPSICEGSHIFDKFLCKGGFEIYKWDLQNGVFVLADINVAMDREGHFLSPTGFLMVMEGYLHLKTFIKLGIYDKQIEMTAGRRRYATLRMMLLEEMQKRKAV